MEQILQRVNQFRANIINLTIMKRILYAVTAGMLLVGATASAQTEGYNQSPVTVSKDKVKKDGVSYYSHVVLEKQTLYSISKTYGVTIQQIYDANPTLDLERSGLKKYQVLMIPIKAEAAPAAKEPEKAAPAVAEPAAKPVESEVKTVSGQEYRVHIVKWYEDIRSIAKKYGLTPEDIMRYNNLDSSTLEWKQQLKIPVDPSAIPQQPIKSEPISTAVDTKIAETVSEPSTTVTTEDEETDGIRDIWNKGQKKVTASLIIPLDATSSTPNENNFDFYSGVLLAVRDLAKEGISTELNVYDCAKKINIIAADIQGSDVVIGPISSADLSTVLALFPKSTGIVSPIEPKAESLVASHPNLIQAPASTKSQCEELIKWLKEEKRWNDKVILFSETGVTPSANATTIINALKDSGISYETISYNVKEGRSGASKLESLLTKTATNRIVVASENKSFLNDVIRISNTMSNKKFDIALYCPSRVRGFDELEVEQFHNTNMHVTLSYFVDYTDSRVKDFLLTYRGLYGKEPSMVAFKGYDAAYYAIKMRSLYGASWIKKLDAKNSAGLQADFRFERTEDGGYTNKAVRRVIYEPSFDIKLAR